MLSHKRPNSSVVLSALPRKSALVRLNLDPQPLKQDVLLAGGNGHAAVAAQLVRNNAPRFAPLRSA